jgi:hypothetical protein
LVAGVDYTHDVGVLFLNGADGGPEDTFTTAAGVAGGLLSAPCPRSLPRLNTPVWVEESHDASVIANTELLEDDRAIGDCAPEEMRAQLAEEEG